MIRHKLISAMSVVLLLLLCLAQTATAFDGRGGERVEVKAGETIEDDLYLSGNLIQIAGTVKGDVFVVGATAIIDGVIEGDLFFGGQSVTINGEVKDDVRAGGAVVTLSKTGKIGGDLLMGGYSLETQAGSTIGGDLLFGGGQGWLAGDVAGDVTAGSGGLHIAGKIGGNVDANIGDPSSPIFNPSRFIPNMPPTPIVAPGLTFGEGASISGTLDYRTVRAADIPANIVKGEVKFSQEVSITPTQQSLPEMLISRGRGALSRFLGTLLVGLLALWLAPGFLRKATNLLTDSFGASTGWGLLTYIGLPIVLLIVIAIALVLAFVFGQANLDWVVDSSVGAVILAAVSVAISFVFALIYLAKVIVALWLGRLLTGQRRSEMRNLFLPLLLGLLILVILLAIPYLGAVVNVIATVIGAGAIWLALRSANPAVRTNASVYALR